MSRYTRGYAHNRILPPTTFTIIGIFHNSSKQKQLGNAFNASNARTNQAYAIEATTTTTVDLMDSICRKMGTGLMYGCRHEYSYQRDTLIWYWVSLQIVKIQDTCSSTLLHSNLSSCLLPRPPIAASRHSSRRHLQGPCSLELQQ